MKLGTSGYSDRQTPHQRISVRVAMVLSVFLVLAWAADVYARSSGGRYGGRAGFSQSRSGSSGGGWSSSRPVPSRPYSDPPPSSYGPSGPMMPSPGFGFLPFLLPFLGWGGGGGASAGSGGSFGFGGVLGILIILGIAVVLGRVLLKNLAMARHDRRAASPAGTLGGERYAVVKCQLALLFTARSLQSELQRYATTASTDTLAGLASALQDVVMALMRYSDYWRHGVVQVQQASTLDDAERSFNQVVGQERAKLSEELTVNVDGVRRQVSRATSTPSDEVGQYLVVTLIVATGFPEFTAYQTPSAKDIDSTLQRFSTLLTSDLLAFEVMWSPENPDDSLTEDELMAEYPELSAL